MDFEKLKGFLLCNEIIILHVPSHLVRRIFTFKGGPIPPSSSSQDQDPNQISALAFRDLLYSPFASVPSSASSPAPTIPSSAHLRYHYRSTTSIHPSTRRTPASRQCQRPGQRHLAFNFLGLFAGVGDADCGYGSAKVDGFLASHGWGCKFGWGGGDMLMRVDLDWSLGLGVGLGLGLDVDGDGMRIWMLMSYGRERYVPRGRIEEVVEEEESVGSMDGGAVGSAVGGAGISGGVAASELLQNTGLWLTTGATFAAAAFGSEGASGFAIGECRLLQTRVNDGAGAERGGSLGIGSENVHAGAERGGSLGIGSENVHAAAAVGGSKLVHEPLAISLLGAFGASSPPRTYFPVRVNITAATLNSSWFPFERRLYCFQTYLGLLERVSKKVGGHDETDSGTFETGYAFQGTWTAL
ncbi:hypothetical protein GYMLUDRAFT_243933 [Collybiopsis luxurians FD-317 M1]|uniref:Uncharacterized protein n=1 Tax=Collybiopsis luxurians FD-317 M1 TaxID=944289 RepID=A0A0D0BYB0_9AGAR|nr:hypothetical protein GYMLUDRAFT_243933 [Collybiopsis luxurians FD-317 M1]